MFFKVLSAIQAGDLARALLSEGCKLASVRELAACQRARDVNLLAVRKTPLLQMVQPYKFTIPQRNAQGLGLQPRTQEMILPHDLFDYMYKERSGFFGRTFAVDQLDAFWARQSPARIASICPEAATDRQLQSRMVPVQLYGDNVSVSKTQSCLVVLWKSAASFRLPALEGLLPVSSTLLRNTDRVSVESVFAVLRWSVDVLATGRHPANDHREQPWTSVTDPTGKRRAAAGKPLAGGYFAVVFEAVGDWEWLSHTFGLNVWKVSYNCHQICYRCPARTHGPFSFKDLSYESGLFSPEMARTLAELAAAVVPLPQLARFRGFCLTLSLLWDWMHVGPLGIEHKSTGNCLIELCTEGFFGHFGGTWRVRIGISLKRAFAAFCVWCRANGLTHSQQSFTCASLSVPDGIGDAPHLKGKAHNIMCVSKWLAAVTNDDAADARRRCRSRVMWSIALLDTLFSTAGQWLTEAEVGQVELARTVLFRSWNVLAANAEGKWATLPKHHAAMHMCKDAVETGRNPGGWWCFGGEHLMGLCKQSTGGNFQPQLDHRILMAALYRLGVVMRDYAPAAAPVAP